MSQVAATRSIQTSLLRPTSGSTQERSQTLLKPPTFSSKNFPSQGNNSSNVCIRNSPINARKSASAEVVPVSPEDDSKVYSFSMSYCNFVSVAWFLR
jgi:pyruvate kinase